MIYLADANFLIRLWRDAHSPAKLRGLASLLDSEVQLVWVVKAEFLRGAVVAGQDYARASEFLGRHKTLWPDDATLALYVEIYAHLRRQNALIGPHDLWIAAAARQHSLPLLTGNVTEFQRVPGVDVVSF